MRYRKFSFLEEEILLLQMEEVSASVVTHHHHSLFLLVTSAKTYGVKIVHVSITYFCNNYKCFFYIETCFIFSKQDKFIKSITVLFQEGNVSQCFFLLILLFLWQFWNCRKLENCGTNPRGITCKPVFRFLKK